MARPGRFELPTKSLEGSCSVQLSYGRAVILLPFHDFTVKYKISVFNFIPIKHGYLKKTLPNKKADRHVKFCHNKIMFTSYTDVCQHLDALGLFHMDLSLDRMEKALQDLHLTNPPFVTIQVVGTNGKGSTSTFLESLARAHGLRTGLFTSPHFVSPSERIRIDAYPLSQDQWPALAQKVHAAAPALTYFEFLTVLAVLAFHEANIDIAIIEAGLGGHYDATTALYRDALCLSPIGMDHEHVLGTTLLAIAEDKAHAMQADKPVFMAQQDSSIISFLTNFAKKRHSQLHSVDTEILPDHISLGLHGAHQKENAALALTAWNWLSTQYGWKCCTDSIHKGLEQAFIAGRLQSITCTEPHLPPHLLLDGAHNVQGLSMLLAHVKNLDKKPSAIIFSCLGDKDIKNMLALLQDIHALCDHCPLYITDIQNNARALTSQEKEHFVQQLGNTTFAAQDLESTLKSLSKSSATLKTQSPVLICGSLYLLGEFFEKYPHYLIQHT